MACAIHFYLKLSKHCNLTRAQRERDWNIA